MITNNFSTIRATMAENRSETSATTSSSVPNWWPDHHVHATSSLSSWSNNTNPNWNLQNPSSNYNSSGEEDVSMSTSFTNASNNSGLSADSSNNELIGETPSDNHLWNQVLLSVGNNGDQDVGDNLTNPFSSKNLSTELFEPACDYLKKMDNSWDFTSSTPFNNFEKSFNGFSDNIFEPERITKLSNSVSNLSIAPPVPEVKGQFDISLNPTYLTHDLKVDNEQKDVEANRNSLGRSFNDNGFGYQMGMNNVMAGDHNSKFYDNIIADVPCNNGRNYADVLTFRNCFSSKPPMNINPPKPILKNLNSSECKKQALQTSYTPVISTCNTLTKSNKRGQVHANEGKNKRLEENSGTVMKKPKHESSTVTSSKIQVPKAKLGDKITALQQIVSPFGKTDTASVLWEAIGYIKYLEEQIQALSNPYKKTNAIKDHRGGLDRKDRGNNNVKFDIKSRGLCLVPVTCTPQVCRENTGPDYLTPAYRGCLYR